MRVVKEKTPFEAWFNIKPTIKHLKFFGSVCYVHVPDEKRSKLDEKAAMGIFVSYGTLLKGYRVYDVSGEKVIVSRDVKFDENLLWD